MVVDNFICPNGLAFDPEERFHSVADTAGRLWTSAGDGVHGYHPDGTLIGEVLIPEMVANVTFGGPKRNRLSSAGRRRFMPSTRR